MKILIIILLTTSVCFAQSVEVGFGFSPYNVSSSTVNVNFEMEDTDYIGRILSYFFTIEVSSDTKYVIIDSSVTIKFNELRNHFLGLGRLESIRLLLIKQKVSDVDVKFLINERKKGKTLKEIAERYNLNYIEEIWLPSKDIYTKIFEVENQ
ncbi:MAG: hypothetical protein N2505_06035 [Endomicrobia bacterium]|nr:hypothetical protein [Endomicrobiia bacterium]